MRCEMKRAYIKTRIIVGILFGDRVCIDVLSENFLLKRFKNPECRCRSMSNL